MRVLWNNHRAFRDPRAGGAERTIYEISRRLVKHGFEVHLLSGGALPYQEQTSADGVTVHSYPGYISPHLALPEVIRRTKPDLVIDDLAQVVPWFSPQLTRKPVVTFFRHLHARTLAGQVRWPLSKALGALEASYPRIYGGLPIVTESNVSREDLIRLGIEDRNVHRIAPGVDASHFRPGTRSSMPSLVYFGGLRRYKRPEHAVRLLSRLVQGGLDCGLTIVGAGPAEEFVRREIQRLALTDRVSVRGKLDDAELLKVIQSGWINVHCSIAEGWCYSVMEAAACGVPTVAYRVPGLLDSVHDRETGILVRDDDVEGLAAATLEILGDWSAYSERCRVFAEGETWDESAEKWELLLGSVTRGVSL